MLKTRKVPMKVNTMPGIIVCQVKDERGEMSGDVNSLQSRDSCLFWKKTGHQKIDCRSYEDWKEKNLNWKTGNMNRKPVSCYNSGREEHISRDCRSKRQDSGWRDEHKFKEADKWRKWCMRQNSGLRDEQQSQGGWQIAEMAESRTDIKEVTKKIASDTAFSVKGFNNWCLETLEMSITWKIIILI